MDFWHYASHLYLFFFLTCFHLFDYLKSTHIWTLEDNQREEEIRGDEQSGVDGQCQTQTGRGGQKGTGTLRVPNPPTLFERPK